jgi:heat shock protein beta
MIVNAANKDPENFNEKIWPVVGSSLKIGTLEDYKNQQKLLKILRFQSSAAHGEITTLDEYVSRRKQGQSQIFYIAGSGMERSDLEKSPFVEKIIARGYEVLFFTVRSIFVARYHSASDLPHRRNRLTKW